VTPEALLKQRIGHGVDSFLASRLEEFLLERLDPGETLPQRLERLSREDLDSAAWLELLSLVLVPKTDFFRHHKQLAQLQSRMANTPRPKIWSAACATGEEVWTLTMLFPTAEVTGTDLSREHLAKARAGHYPRYNQPQPPFDELLAPLVRPDGIRVSPSLQQRVRFRRLNLAATERYPTVEGGWDLIFCRNVLIYFDAELRRSVLGRMRELLSPEGLIVLSPAERAPEGTPLRAVPLGGNHFAYAPGWVQQVPSRWTPPKVTWKPAWRARTPLRTPAPLLRKPTPRSAPTPPPLAEVSAERGEGWRLHDEAAALEHSAPQTAKDVLAKAAELADLDEQLHWAIGRAFRRLQANSEAERELRRTLLLAPHLWAAAFQLAGVLHDEGRFGEAEREYERTLRLMDRHPGDADPFYRQEAVTSCKRRIAECRARGRRA
jgi:chemotaxis protein methyltransferase CheR